MIATAALRRPRPHLRRLPAEALVFAGATIIALVHALDDALVHREPGVAADRHALAVSLAVGLAVAAIAGFRRLRPGLRAGIAFAFGGLATVNGALHTIHVLEHGASGGDVTGVLAAAAGLTLVGLAVAIPWPRRGTGTWRARAVAVPATMLGALFVVAPVGMAIVEVHKWRSPVGEPPSAAYEDVTFRSSDGLELSGWYRPSRNGAAIVVVHGGGSDRKGSVAHAQMLARHGYGVLLYDARGRGDSEGAANSYGWGWEKDAAGAVEFLRTRERVIGGLGLSSGADTLVDVAATRPDLRAVVADGAALRTFEDARRLGKGSVIEGAAAWTLFKAVEVLSGDSPPAPLEELVSRIESPLLLISAGRAAEYDYNVLYERAARPTTQHWNLPDAHHTDALREYPAAYERRVIGFFDAALGG